MTHSKSVNTGEKWKEKCGNAGKWYRKNELRQGGKKEGDLGKENKLENIRIDLAGEGEHADF